MTKSLFRTGFALGAGVYFGKFIAKAAFTMAWRILENTSLKAANNMKPGKLQEAIVYIFGFEEEAKPDKKNPIGFCSNGVEG